MLSQSARTWPGPIPIQVIHQPSSAFIVGSLPDVTNVQYFAPVDVADRVSSSAFVATVDLATANAAASEPILVPVRLQGPDGVNIIDYTPREIYVRLDPLVTSTVPVTVDHGTVPEGLRLGETTVSQSTATVSGPESVVNQVVAAVARVRIQSSGIDVDQLVDLVPVDGQGEVLSPVELTPTSVRVLQFRSGRRPARRRCRSTLSSRAHRPPDSRWRRRRSLRQLRRWRARPARCGVDVGADAARRRDQRDDDRGAVRRPEPAGRHPQVGEETFDVSVTIERPSRRERCRPG